MFYALLFPRRAALFSRENIAFLINYNIEDGILELFDKKFKLPYKRTHCLMAIIDFPNLEELNLFLSKFGIFAESIETGHMAFGAIVSKWIIHIKLFVGSKEQKKFNSKMSEAFLELYKAGHIGIFRN